MSNYPWPEDGSRQLHLEQQRKIDELLPTLTCIHGSGRYCAPEFAFGWCPDRVERAETIVLGAQS